MQLDIDIFAKWVHPQNESQTCNLQTHETSNSILQLTFESKSINFGPVAFGQVWILV